MFLGEGIERQLKVGQAEVVEQLSSRLTRCSRTAFVRGDDSKSRSTGIEIGLKVAI